MVKGLYYFLLASLTFSLGLSLFALIFSDKLIFPVPRSHYIDSSDILKLQIEDGSLISARYLPAEESSSSKAHESSYIILYSHGNGEDLGSIAEDIALFHEAGFSVFAYDYPGYGTSQGKPHEKNVYESIHAAYRYIIESLKISPNQIIVYGRSLGGGPAIELASQKPVAALILHGTFTSTFRVMTHIKLLPWDKFDNLSKIGSVNCPVFVIHGRKDKTVPFWHGQALYNAIRAPKQFLWLDECGHNDILSEKSALNYWKSFNQFIQSLKP